MQVRAFAAHLLFNAHAFRSRPRNKAGIDKAAYTLELADTFYKRITCRRWQAGGWLVGGCGQCWYGILFVLPSSFTIVVRELTTCLLNLLLQAFRLKRRARW